MSNRRNDAVDAGMTQCLRYRDAQRVAKLTVGASPETNGRHVRLVPSTAREASHTAAGRSALIMAEIR